MSPDVMPEDKVLQTTTEPGTKSDRAHSRARAARRRTLVIVAARVLLLAAVLGLWEWLSRAKVIDPFNFSMPSKIWDQIYTWVTHGTALGSLGEQIWYTLQEALLGWTGQVLPSHLRGVDGLPTQFISCSGEGALLIEDPTDTGVVVMEPEGT